MSRDNQTLVDTTMLRKDATGNMRLPEPPKSTAETVSAEHLALGPLDGRYSQIGKI